jgi:hypothetical protein
MMQSCKQRRLLSWPRFVRACSATDYYDAIGDDEMGWTCSAQGADEKYVQNFGCKG